MIRCSATDRRRRAFPLALRAIVVVAAASMPLPLWAQEVVVREEPAPTPAAKAESPVSAAVGGTDMGTLPTLMFSLSELLQIETALREGGHSREAGEVTAEPLRPRLRDPLYLSGIVYGGVGDWTVWLNGRSMRPTDPKGNLFEVIEVTARQVVVLVAWGDTTRQVILEPNQTFDPIRGQVLEGRGL